MLTDKQNIKLKQLSDLYFNNQDAIEEITKEKLMEILRKNCWHLSNSLHEVMNYHNSIFVEKNRIKNLPKNVVKSLDNQGHMEIWGEFYKCPNCGKVTLSKEHKEKYCHECGIKVDWSEII